MAALVLVVDDDLDFLELARERLEQAGLEVHTAASGRAALECWRRDQPDVAVLDLMMPELDGSEVARVFRKLRDEGGIVVASGAEDVERVARDIGADGWLAKPLRPDALVRAIRRAIESRAHRVLGGHHTPHP
jgi:CheY-like chemotaxis protein